MTSKLSAFSFKDVSVFTKSVQDLSWSLDGAQLATACSDRAFRVAQVEPQGSAKLVQTITCSSGAAAQVKWHPSERQRFAVAGDDVAIDIWDIRAPKPATRVSSLGSNIYLAWSPDGKFLASVNRSDALVVFDAVSGQQIKDLRFANEINEIAWSSNSDYLLVASGLGGVEVVHFTPQTEEQSSTLDKLDFVPAHTSNCHQLKLWDPADRSALNRQQAVMAVGGSDFQVTLWDLDELICHSTICLESEVRGICLSSDGNYLGIASEDPNISFYSTTTGKLLTKAESRTTFNAMAWHPTANLVAAAVGDRIGTGGSAPSFLRFLSFSNA